METCVVSDACGSSSRAAPTIGWSWGWSKMLVCIMAMRVCWLMPTLVMGLVLEVGYVVTGMVLGED